MEKKSEKFLEKLSEIREQIIESKDESFDDLED
jgi:hypothetical protein